jgi:hypothetical protein
MALNFSRCVAIFGSSWSEARSPNTTFSPSPLAGLLGRTERSRHPRTATGESARRTCVGTRLPGRMAPDTTTAATAAGATDGNHGENTGTHGNPQRPPTHKGGSGQAPDRQQKQRVSADSSCVFLFGRGVWKPVALVAGALPSPRVLAMLRRARGKQREQRPTQACAPTEKPALL